MHMKLGTGLVAAALAVAAAAPAQAAIVADFELNGSTANAVGNGVTLATNGGALGATGITFGLNQGPTVSGLGALAAYTIDIGFTLSRLTGPAGSDYVKLIDFSGLANDAGYYSYRGYLSAYPLGASNDKVFAADTPVRLTLSRDTAGLVTAYIDGTQIFSAADPTNRSATLITALQPLNFFTDDSVTTQREASAGFVDYIRIADTAMTPGQVGPVTPSVPEPASWAMMIAGFGAVGATLRRRPRATAAMAHG